MKTRKSFFPYLVYFALFVPAVCLFRGSMTPFAQVFPTETSEAPEFQYEISVSMDGMMRTMELEEYLVGVVLAEMPAEFEMEALKAQAIVARTFAQKALHTGGKHGDGSICTTPSCCQGYVSEESYLEVKGSQEGLDKIRTAVASTAGMVLTYQGELIEATYFSSSGGYTEDAAAVWGSSYPYLVAKMSPEALGENSEETKAFSQSYLEELLQTQMGEDPQQWFTDWKKTRGGGVESVVIGNRKFTGTELRRKLELRSTLFYVTQERGVIFFHTKGFGHRVGMSQFGADTLAVSGKTCEEILSYYYTGTKLEKISEIY